MCCPMKRQCSQCKPGHKLRVQQSQRLRSPAHMMRNLHVCRNKVLTISRHVLQEDWQGRFAYTCCSMDDVHHYGSPWLDGSSKVAIRRVSLRSSCMQWQFVTSKRQPSKQLVFIHTPRL